MLLLSWQGFNANQKISQLIATVEAKNNSLITVLDQEVWSDPESGFKRTLVSPSSASLKGEVVKCELAANKQIQYGKHPIIGREHHLVMLGGELRLQIGDAVYDLRGKDCLRYCLDAPSKFSTSSEVGAQYFLFMV